MTHGEFIDVMGFLVIFTLLHFLREFVRAVKARPPSNTFEWFVVVFGISPTIFFIIINMVSIIK